MILSLNQIGQITQGAARIREEKDGIHFYRFSREEQELYTDQRADICKATAGIQWEFKTDGKTLRLKGKTAKACNRLYYAFDVFVNRQRIGILSNFSPDTEDFPYKAEDFPLGQFQKTFDLGEGEKLVRVVFPWSVEAVIEEAEVAGATYVEPVRRKKILLTYGDSITQGYDAMYPGEAYSVRLADFLGAEAFNKAICGEVYFPPLAGVKGELAPDYITVAYGSNDWKLLNKKEFEQRCRGFLANLVRTYPGVKTIVICPSWRKDYRKPREFGDFRDVEVIIRGICTQWEQIRVLSAWNYIPHDEVFFADRRLHPNDEGFAHYFRQLKAELENMPELLQEERSEKGDY